MKILTLLAGIINIILAAMAAHGELPSQWYIVLTLFVLGVYQIKECVK